jgi:hypothetical protein
MYSRGGLCQNCFCHGKVELERCLDFTRHDKIPVLKLARCPVALAAALAANARPALTLLCRLPPTRSIPGLLIKFDFRMTRERPIG